MFDLYIAIANIVFFFGLGGASVFVLRRKRPDAVRPYRSLGYPILPALFVVAAAVGIISAFVAAPRTSLFGTALLLAGVVVHTVTRARQAR